MYSVDTHFMTEFNGIDFRWCVCVFILKGAVGNLLVVLLSQLFCAFLLIFLLLSPSFLHISVCVYMDSLNE